MGDDVEVKTEEPEAPMATPEVKPKKPRGWEPSTHFHNNDLFEMKQEIINMKEAFNTKTKEIQSLQSQLYLMIKNQERMHLETKKFLENVCSDKQCSTESVSTLSVSSSKPKCILCNLDDHLPHDCKIFETPAERMEVMRWNQLCLRCLEPLNNSSQRWHRECPIPLLKCSTCRVDYHRSMFCEMKIPVKISKAKCKLCESRAHITNECPEYVINVPVNNRRYRLFEQNRCFQCFQENDDKLERNHTTCAKWNYVCRRCFRAHGELHNASHHPLLCDYYYDIQTEGKKRVPALKSQPDRPPPYWP